MRFRTGLVVGLAVGYYYGARAGRERYLQIEQWLDRLRTAADTSHARVKLADGVREGRGVAWRLVQRRGAEPPSAPAAADDPAASPMTPPDLGTARSRLRRRRRADDADLPRYGDPTLN